MRGEIVGCPTQRSPQVGAADVSDEQGIAGEDGVRFCRVLLQIEHQDRDRFDGVSRCFENLYAQPWELERVSVLHRHKCVFRLCAGTKTDGSAAAVAQLQMPSNEVSMEVGQEDVADFEAKFPSVDQVLVNIALWVDDNRGRSRLVTE